MLGRTGELFLAAAMFLGVCLIAAATAQGSESAAMPDAKGLSPLLIAWLTVTVYFAGGAMILVAFAYFYRPGPWLRVCAKCAVLAAVALAIGSGLVAWHGKTGNWRDPFRRRFREARAGRLGRQRRARGRFYLLAPGHNGTG